MTTTKTWTPPPEMPASLPPLPVGKNGKPLVYVGKGHLEPTTNGEYYSDTRQEGWAGDFDGNGSYHYAAESDSEICRLNQWGDFAPDAKPAQPAPQTTIAAYLASAEAAIQEADAAFQAATENAAAWANELQARRDIRDRLQGDTALARRAWFEAGRKCQRHHGKIPTTFPALPG